MITASTYAGCPESPHQLQSYREYLQRQEIANDPDHAAQLDKVLIEISKAEAGAVHEDIKAGLSPNATVKTSSIGPGVTHTEPTSLLTVAVSTFDP